VLLAGKISKGRDGGLLGPAKTTAGQAAMSSKARAEITLV
jgi:hypothetical protein